MIQAPEILRTDRLPTAVIRVTVPRAKMRTVMGPGRQELFDALAEQGIAPVGPWYTHHLRMDPGEFDFEIGVPVPKPVAPKGRVMNSELPAAMVARTVYRGPYEGLPSAWGEFDAWIKQQGHTIAPDLWEIYAVGPESGADPAAWRTELNRPLAHVT